VKIVLAGCMLFGRLEVFTLLALFSREFWRR
jgi:Trk-type K+ transport system membrane component